ncbi:MAG: multinuclear nonheme iron-dependent oxidase [Anaerolineae bacterium]
MPIAHPWPAFGDRPLLGANGSEAMPALLERGGAPLLDYLKVGPFMGTPAIAALAPRHPLMLHLDVTLSGHAPLDDEAMRPAADLAALTGTPWTSAHIGFGVADVTLDQVLVTQPASPLLSRAEALENIVCNARSLADRLPVRLLLENIPLFPNLAHLRVCEPDFVCEVIARTGCDLLLDLAHARVSADVLGCAVHDYLEDLPLERTVEIHLSGPRRVCELDPVRRERVLANAAGVAHLLSFDEGRLMDAHEAMRDEDYALLEWVLGRIQPKAVSLEYYRDTIQLEEQLIRLNEIVGR